MKKTISVILFFIHSPLNNLRPLLSRLTSDIEFSFLILNCRRSEPNYDTEIVSQVWLVIYTEYLNFLDGR